MVDGGAAVFRILKSPREPSPAAVRRRLAGLALASVLALTAGAAALLLPPGSVLRMALAVPVMLFLPGHLLLQVMLPPAPTSFASVERGLVAVGLSPAVVGLLAMATVVTPWGFSAPAIIVAVTGTCLLLSAAATLRWSGRGTGRASARPAEAPGPSEQT